jgi:hypothetical protein
MKTKLKILKSLTLVILATMLLSGCKKDSTTTSDSIVGTWTTGTPTFTVTVGDKTLEQYFIDVAGLDQATATQYTALFNLLMQQEFMGSITIKEDGTYSSTMGGSTETGTWVLSDDEKTLTITPSGSDPVTVNIVEKTSDQMKAQISTTIEQDLNADGIDETVSVDIELTFTRS